MNGTQRLYSAIDFPPLTEEQRKELEVLKNMPNEEIDTSDISICTGNGGFYYYQSLKIPQTDIHTKIDNDTLEWLKSFGKGYQRKMNNVLRWARMNNCPIMQM
jgi:uncharacterized protein (DUF4415 family)